MPRPTLLLTLAMLPTVLWAQENTPAGVNFTHHDWELACDNTRTCRAAGYQSDDDQLPVSVLLTRRAGPQQPVTGQLKLGALFDDSEQERLPDEFLVAMSIDGRELGEVEMRGEEWRGELSANQLTALLAALPGTSDIRWKYQEFEWHLSDSGASAVLLKMDDAQGRVGTPDALTKKGSRSESKILPPLPMPVVVAAPLVPPQLDDPQRFAAQEAAIRASLRNAVLTDECSGLSESNDESQPLEFNRLTSSKLLVSTTCWMAAYNMGDGYWVINDAPPYQPVPVTDSGSGFDNGTIVAGHKSRGLGDCWHTNSWTWDGVRFVHVEAISTGLCKGFAGGAWELPELVMEVRGGERSGVGAGN